MKNTEFDKIMQSKLQGLESTPPKGTFAAIQNRLKAKAPAESKAGGFIWPPMLKYGLAASVAFMFGLITMNWLNNNNQESNLAVVEEASPQEITVPVNTAEQNTENIETFTENDVSENAVIENTSVENVLTAVSNESATSEATSTQVQKITVVPSPTKAIIKSSSYQASSNDELEIFNEEQGKIVINVAGVYAAKQIEEKENIEIYALYAFENELEEEKIEIAKVEEEPTITRFDKNSDKMGYTGFWFGPTISGNHQTMSAKSIFGLGLGVDFGYDFKPNFGVQTGFHYKSMLKDVETISETGTPYHDLMDYSHFSIPLAMKWKHSYFADNIKRPVSFNAYVGGDYARLTKLNKNQLGAHLGLEYDIFMKPEMMFTVGVKTGMYSILDYNPGQSHLHDNYRKFNYAMSLYASLRFVSPKRR